MFFIIKSAFSAFFWAKMAISAFGLSKWFATPQIQIVMTYAISAILYLFAWVFARSFVSCFRKHRPRVKKVLLLAELVLIGAVAHSIVSIGVGMKYDPYPKGSAERERRLVVNHFLEPMHSKVSKNEMKEIEMAKNEIKRKGGDHKKVDEVVNKLIKEHKLFKAYKLTTVAINAINKIYTPYCNPNREAWRYVQTAENDEKADFYVTEEVKGQQEIEGEKEVHVSSAKNKPQISSQQNSQHSFTINTGNKPFSMTQKTIIIANIIFAMIVLAYYSDMLKSLLKKEKEVKKEDPIAYFKTELTKILTEVPMDIIQVIAEHAAPVMWSYYRDHYNWVEAAEKGDTARLEDMYRTFEIDIDHIIFNKDKYTTLHLSAELGHLDCVKFLVKNGAHLESRDWINNTPLILSVKKGHLPCIKYLVEQGANLYAKNIVGYTLLELAEKHSSVFQYLEDVYKQRGMWQYVLNKVYLILENR